MLRRLSSLGPPAAALAAVLTALGATGVPVRDVLVYLALQVVCFTLPGLLLWRAFRGRTGSWLHDGVLGTVLGHAATVAIYLPARALGAPRLVWGLALVPVLFACAPGLRHFWRTGPGSAEPRWLSWSLAGCVAALCAWFAGLTTQNPVAGRNLLWQSSDHPYFLAIAGELRNHVPPVVPFVVHERLDYHWFAMADTAAMSWQSGQDLSILLFRLLPATCLLLTFLGFGLLTERLCGRKAAVLLGVLVPLVVGTVHLVHGADAGAAIDATQFATVVDSTLLMIYWFGSPTQAFGQLLAVAVLYVVIDLLRAGSAIDGAPRAARRGSWALLVLLTAVLMGAKATFLPVIGAGVVVVGLGELARTHRPPRVPLLIGAVLGVELVFAQVVLFGGASQGLGFAAGEDFRGVAGTAGLPGRTSGVVLLVTAAYLVLMWLAPLAGARLVAGDRAGPATRALARDPSVLLVAGMVVAGLGAVGLLRQGGFSEYYFLRASLPFGYLLVAWGLVAWVGAARSRGLPLARVLGVVVTAAAAGLVVVALARAATTSALPERAAAVRLLLVLAATAVVTLLVSLLLARRLVRGQVALRMTVWACVSACTLGMGAARTIDMARAFPLRTPVFDDRFPTAVRPLPQGALEAARFVRDRTGPDELLATNAHCRIPAGRTCDARAFWLAAYAERRVVIEGWAYTATANATSPSLSQAATTPYWDPPLLALNDAVFTHPSAAALRALVRRFPVRWLVVDARFPADVPGLAALLPVSRRFGEVTVFSVPREDSGREPGD